MAWTTPTVRATGYLVTASDWNTDLVNNLAYLKGKAGQVIIEDDLIPNSGSLTIGETANPFNVGVFNQLYAKRYSVQQAVRTIILPWEDPDDVRYQVNVSEGGGFTVNGGGTGQCVLKVDDDGAGNCYISNQAAQNSAKDTSFNGGRSPFGRFEFTVDEDVANTEIFIGYRQTIGGALPGVGVENYFGIFWDGSSWSFDSSNGSSTETQVVTPAANARHVIEIIVISGTQVDCYLDGTLEATFTNYLPTGDLEWQALLISDGGGGGTDTFLTCGLFILQEDLS